MKKFLLFTATCLFLNLLHATTYNVEVANYQFTPSTVNAIVGDTITWTWLSGSHTTTSTSVPAGAKSWDEAMNSSSTTFTYKLTAAGTYSYWCTPHSPDMAGNIEVSGVLPVTLTAFSIAATGNSANIQWHTANEQNILFYTVKKSNDGTNFTAIGQVPALNKSNVNTYSFTDKTVATGDKYLYYYIDITDKDGSHTTSAIQTFKNVFAKTGLLRQVFPNPVSGTDHLMLQFYADKPGKMLVELYDPKGTLVKQIQMASVEGLNNGHFHTGTLATGTYMLQCTLDGKKETRQIVVK